MRLGKGHMLAWAAAASAVVLWSGAAAKDPPANRLRLTTTGSWMLMELPAAGAAGSRPVAAAGLSGGTVTVRLAGRAPDVTWQLGFGRTILAQGRVRPGAAGFGRIRIVLPEVRHRIECKLLVIGRAGAVARTIVLFPRSLLTGSGGYIRVHRLGVIDRAGRVRRALQAERAPAEHLGTRHAEDYFNGGTVLLAGFARAEALAEACGRLAGRVKRGMTVVILNPPVGWEGWGVRAVKLSGAVRAGVRLAKGFGTVLRPGDIGAGPWRAALRAGEKSSTLAWIETRAGPGRKGRPAREVRPLIVARRAGRGRAIVTMLPQLDDPAGSAVGRMLLDELILWVIRPGPAGGSGKETLSWAGN